METIKILECSFLVNIILLFCLFAPNIVYLIHKKHFKWKDDNSEYIKGAQDYCKSPLNINEFIKKYKNI